MTLVLARRPDPPSAEATRRRYHRRAERLAIAEAVLADAVDGGTIGRATVRDLAQRAGRSRRQARRMVDEWLEAAANPRPAGSLPALPDEFLVAVAELNGNVAAAIRRFYGEESYDRVRSRVYRALERDLGMRLALKEGPQALERYLEVGGYVPKRRNELWLVDETKLPIVCRGPRGRIEDEIWAITVIDACTRFILNAQLVVVAADAVITAAVLAGAMVGGELDGIPYGGSPDAVGMDNALIYKSDPVRDTLRVGGVHPDYARPYTPTDKAIKERWYGTFKTKFLAGLPGNLRGARRRIYAATGEFDAHGRPKRSRADVPVGMPVDPADLPTLDEVAQAVAAAVLEYNLRHVHSAIGTTPLAAWAEQRTPLRRPGVAAFWPYALVAGSKPTYTGERRGVHLDGEWRRGDQPLQGRLLTARVLPGVVPRYLIGTPDGRFLEEVTPMPDETEAQRNARLGRNRAKVAQLGRILTTASEQTRARVAAEPATPAYVSARQERSRDAAAAPRLADAEAALEVPPAPGEVA